MSLPKRNLAARAGHWSAKHRKIAIGGWLAFVVIAFVLGGAIGTNTLSDDDSGNGQSRVADKAITKADFPDKADEQVLVQSRDWVLLSLLTAAAMGCLGFAAMLLRRWRRGRAMAITLGTAAGPTTAPGPSRFSPAP